MNNPSSLSPTTSKVIQYFEKIVSAKNLLWKLSSIISYPNVGPLSNHLEPVRANLPYVLLFIPLCCFSNLLIQNVILIVRLTGFQVGSLYIVGGMDASTKGPTSVDKFCLRTNTWSSPTASMTGRRLQFGVAVVENKIYVVGGRDGLKTLSTVSQHDLCDSFQIKKNIFIYFL